VGKGGSYRGGRGGERVKYTLMAPPPMGANGLCCDMLFPGPPPTPACTALGGGATLG
jgi:hypothetical protein